MKLSTIRRLIKEADATAAPSGDFDEFMSSIEQLEKHAKERRVMEPDYSKQDLLSDIHRELPDIDSEMADKMVDFVFKHIDADVTEASISVDMQEAPTAEELDVGEPVKIVGKVEYHGKCGHIDSFGRDKRFVIVDLGNDGLRSFHSSDVSYYAADDNDEEEDGDIEESAEQGVEEAGLKFNGGFPDVDHMNGPRGINLPSAPTKKFFTDKKQWERAVNDINSSKYDDNSEYTGQTGRSTVSIDGREWARWSDAQQKGYIELSSMSEQGVAEAEKNPHTSALGKALYRDLSKEKKARPEQVEKNKARWAKNPHNPANKEGVSVDEDAEGEKPTTWYKDNKAYSLQRTGSTFSLLDQSGKVVQIIQVPPRYIPMNLEDQGYKMSRTGREYYKNPGWFKESAGDNPEDVITVDVPLFIRLMEYAREDAKTDMDLHVVTEKLTAMSAEGRTLSMADYDAIISTDTVEEETVNEVSPHNFDSDIDYYDALRARKPQRQEPDDDIGHDDDYNDRLRSKPSAAKPTQHLNNDEGVASNGKKYNNSVTFSGGSAAANKAAADSFADYHWGAKDVVDAKQKGDNYVLYVVDNHKYGMWKPWKEAKVGEAAGQKEKSAFQKGYEAGLSRRPEPNPYAAGTKENAEFRDGEHNGRADRDTHYESTITKGVVLNEYAAFKKGVK